MSDLSQGTPVKPTPVARDQDILISIVLATAITISTGPGLTAYDVGCGVIKAVRELAELNGIDLGGKQL